MSSAAPGTAYDLPAAAVGFEVATVTSDTLRAGITVQGVLSPATCPLLSSVLRCHLVAGRRYLRVDLREASVVAPGPDGSPVLDALLEAHTAITDLGGMLVIEHADAPVAEALRAASLFVTPAD